MKMKQIIPIYILLAVLSSAIAYQLEITGLKAGNELNEDATERVIEETEPINSPASPVEVEPNDEPVEEEAIEIDNNLAIPLQGNAHNKFHEGYYIVMTYNGKITVFDYFMDDFEAYFYTAILNEECEEGDLELYKYYYLKDNASEYIIEIIDMPLSLLSGQEQEMLDKGIEVNGEDELIRLLENYTS